jgi:hypothetical protein
MTESASRSFSVPLTLPTPSRLSTGNTDPLESHHLIENSCSEAQATVLVSWGLSGPELAESRGAVFGCKDGTIYVFKPLSGANAPQNSNRSPPAFSADADVTSRPSTPSIRPRSHSRSAYPGSRSASPSSSLAFQHATFNMTSRSHAVSGLSKEQAEAPKNHVDFEDEPEKLREMLQGKGVRDKTVVDNIVPSFDKGLVLERSPPIVFPSGTVSSRKDEARSLLSATNSPPFTPRSLSVPSSPSLVPVTSSNSRTSRYPLSLLCHIIPNRPGAVSAIQLLDNNRLLVVLQDNG